MEVKGARLSLKGLKIGNERIDKIFESMGRVIDAAITVEERQRDAGLHQKYEDVSLLITEMKSIFRSLRSRTALKTDQIKSLQDTIDLTAARYIRLFGAQRITNYFHLLFSGHVRDYLVKCEGSIYK